MLDSVAFQHILHIHCKGFGCDSVSDALHLYTGVRTLHSVCLPCLWGGYLLHAWVHYLSDNSVTHVHVG